MTVPDYNNPTQEMIDSIGQYSQSSDIERAQTESLLRRMYEHLGIDLEDE